MYIFGTVISVVSVIFALLWTTAMTNIQTANAAIGDPIAQGFIVYDTAYEGFMEAYGSASRKIFPSTNSDLFPKFGFMPVAPFGGSWLFVLDTTGGSVMPLACATVTVNGKAILEAIKQAAYSQGASVIEGSQCTGSVKVAGNLTDSSFPITISAVKHYSGKAIKTIGAN